MSTPLAYQIGSLLLPICLEETNKARELYKKQETSGLAPEVAELYSIFEAHKRLGASKEAIELFRRCSALYMPTHKEAILGLKLPHDLKDIMPVYSPFTVIVIEHDYSDHRMSKDVPRIVTHGKDKTTLWHDGEPQNKYNYKPGEADETRVATDDEVEACVTSLTVKQLRTVMNSDLFAPIVNTLFEEQTELVKVEDNEA